MRVWEVHVPLDSRIYTRLVCIQDNGYYAEHDLDFARYCSSPAAFWWGLKAVVETMIYDLDTYATPCK